VLDVLEELDELEVLDGLDVDVEDEPRESVT
jgi:hypothetical protein